MTVLNTNGEYFNEAFDVSEERADELGKILWGKIQYFAENKLQANRLVLYQELLDVCETPKEELFMMAAAGNLEALQGNLYR